MTDTLETLAAQTLESRRRNIRDEIARQADMQFCVNLTRVGRHIEWTDPIDQAVAPRGRKILTLALLKAFPFMTPQTLNAARTWEDLFIDILQRVPAKTTDH